MSHLGPTGRCAPRWSVLGQPALSPALMAGLSGSRALVRVGPPLLAGGRASGLPVTLATPHELSGNSRLAPTSVRVRVQSLPALEASSTLCSTTLAPAARANVPPLPGRSAELLRKVVLVTATVALESALIAPPIAPPRARF